MEENPIASSERPPAISRSFRFWASTFYFAFYAASGVFFPFLNIHYQQSGITIQQIGLLAALPMLMNLVANPLWAMAADAFRMHSRLLPLCMLLAIPVVWTLTHSSGFWALAGLALLYALVTAPIMSLGDHAVTEALGAARYEYGRMRIWGAVGFGLSAWAGGYLMERFGIQRSILSYVVIMGLGVFVATRLPKPRLVLTTPFWKSIRIFTTDHRWYGFLGGIFLAGIGFSTLNNYLILYMRSLGAGEGLFGLGTAIAGLSELPIFFFSTQMMRRWSPRGLIGIAFGALAVRLLLISLVRDPNLILALQLLHGLSFSAIWTAGVSYASEIAQAGLGASAQSLFGTTLFALAGIIGAFGGGQIYQNWGPSALFQAAALLSVCGALIFFSSRPSTRTQSSV